jgi:dihydroorotase
VGVSRRDFVIAAGAGAGAIAAPASIAAAAAPQRGEPPIPLTFDPNDAALKYDLVLTGGTVIDPASKLHARRDIGIKNGQIAAVSASIDAARGLQTFDARGLYLAPGFIDLHCHYFHQISGIGLPADEMMPLTLTTTGVDAGDAGYSTFSGFRHFIAGQARTRLYAFIHIAAIGLTGDPIAIGELFNIDYAQVDKCAKAVAENRDMVLGVKVRM